MVGLMAVAVVAQGGPATYAGGQARGIAGGRAREVQRDTEKAMPRAANDEEVRRQGT
jgi:hypothetical protein